MVTLVAACLAWPVREWRLVHHRRIVLDEVQSKSGSVVGPWPGQRSPHSGLRGLFDDVLVSEIALMPKTTQTELMRVQAAFPEADVYIATDASYYGAYGRPEQAGQRPTD